MLLLLYLPLCPILNVNARSNPTLSCRMVRLRPARRRYSGAAVLRMPRDLRAMSPSKLCNVNASNLSTPCKFNSRRAEQWRRLSLCSVGCTKVASAQTTALLYSDAWSSLGLPAPCMVQTSSSYKDKRNRKTSTKVKVKAAATPLKLPAAVVRARWAA